MTSVITTETRDVILNAALTCFRTRGMQKTTIIDIAKCAGVSRSTVYEYFADKAAIVQAAAERASQFFYRELSVAMEKGVSLEDKLARAATVVTSARKIVEPEMYFDADEVNVLMTKNAAVLLAQCGDFLAPYLTAAKLTGEVRKDLDVGAAGEWFARILFSLFTTPSSRLDFDDAEVLKSFVRAHAVKGFADNAPVKRTAKG